MKTRGGVSMENHVTILEVEREDIQLRAVIPSQW